MYFLNPILESVGNKGLILGPNKVWYKGIATILIFLV